MDISKVSPEFAADLIALVNGFKGIEFNGKVDYTSKKTGERTKFEYVTLDKIYSHVKANNNFAILEPLGTNDRGESALQVIIIHKSGEAITSDYYKLRVNENGSKQDEGAAITYTKRYAIGSFLGLCTDEDNDANPDGEGMGLKNPPAPPPPQYISKAQGAELVKIANQKWGESAGAVFTKITGYKSTKEIPVKEFNAVKRKVLNSEGFQDALGNDG